MKRTIGRSTRTELTLVALAWALVTGCSTDSKKSVEVGDAKANSADAGPASNWTSMGYDIGSTYHNTSETKLSKDNVGDLVPKWSAKVLVYGTPTVANDKIYVGGSDGIYAFALDGDGTPLWKYSEGNAVGANATLSYEDGVLYVMPNGGANVIALDVTGDSPSLKWDQPVTGLAGFSSPIVVGDYVVVGISALDTKVPEGQEPFRGGVTALNKSDGTVLWNSPTAVAPEDGCSVWGTVAVDPDAGIVYAPVGNDYTKAGPSSDSIVAYDLKTGDKKWSSQVKENDVFNLTDYGPADHDFGANPVVFDSGGTKYVAAGNKGGSLFVWDRIAGGKPLYTRDLGGASAFSGGVFQALAWDGEHLVTVCNNAKSTEPGAETQSDKSPLTSVLFAFTPDLTKVYERQLGAAVWGPLTIANGVGYMGVDSTLEAFDIKTGEMLKTVPLKDTIPTGLTVANGHVVFGSGMSWISARNDDKGSLQVYGLP